MMRRGLQVLRGLGALLVLTTLTVGMPWLLVVAVGNPYPEEGMTLAGRLTDHALVGAVAALAWLVWAQLVVCVLVEAIAEIRLALGRSADWLTRVPGTFESQQQLARTLVQAVVVAIAGTAALAPAVPPVARAAAEPIVVLADETPDQPVLHAPEPQDRPTTSLKLREVTVERGDTLWSLAERYLGAGESWREIADLNTGRSMPAGEHFSRSSSIQPGWTLLIPEVPTAAAAVTNGHVTVERGDSLWSIAAEGYGDGAQWPRLYAANRDRIDDPNLIYPGQVLRLPDQERRPEPTSGEPAPGPSTDRVHPMTASQDSVAGPEVGAGISVHARAGDQAETQDDADPSSGLVAVLTGGGALLGAGLLSSLMVRRRVQYRKRRSGRVVAHTPPGLAPTEAAIQAAGDELQDEAEVLDSALRELVALIRDSDSVSTLPHVAAVRVASETIELHLVTPLGVSIPEPWRATEDGMVLIRDCGAPIAVSDSLAPYPTLVSVGVDESGATWLLDLEAAGIVRVLGDADLGADLARFMVAELAVSPWSDSLLLNVGDFAESVTSLAPERISTQGGDVADLLVRAAHDVVDSTHVTGHDVLAGRLDGRSAEAWNPIVAIVAAERISDQEMDHLARAIHWPLGRKAVALVVLGGEGRISHASLELTVLDDGSMSIEPLGVKVKVNRLNEEAAAQVGALIAHHRDADDEPMPQRLGGHAYDQVSDAAGALVVDALADRDSEEGESLLPLPDATYLERAATTDEDLATLAPRVPRRISEEILALDPALDADLSEWRDPETLRPRVGVLGPVELLVAQEPTGDARNRRAYAAEVVTYLVTHPQGTTTEQLACAFDVKENVVHNYVAAARKWVGIDPETGVSYIPGSMKTEAARRRGMAVYQVSGVLSDEDLFRRLRVRAQARGHDGVEDLAAALRLVRGRPFDQIRRRGYRWLAETPIDHQLTAAIVDVAHIVATNALASGDWETAGWAAEKAILAAPDEEKPRLDLAAAMRAKGEEQQADNFLDREVHDRSDEGDVPGDLGSRTQAVLHRSRHGRPASRRAEGS